MRRSILAAVIGSGLLLSASAVAEGLDSSKPLVCDLAEATQCDGAKDCKDVTFAQIDIPPVLKVDFAASQLLTEDGQRRSSIATVEAEDEVLVLQGHEEGRGWTMVIERATGHLSATIADSEGAFVIEGACAPSSGLAAP